jgi:hypothetical protein
MISSSIHFFASDIISSFLMSEYYSITYIYHIFFIHSSGDGPLGWVHNHSAAINMGVQVSLFDADLHSFEYMPKSGIAGSYSSSIFSFLWSLHAYFLVPVLIYISISNV